VTAFIKKSLCYIDLNEEFECLGKKMFIFYRFLCFKSSVNTHVLVLLGYQKLLKFINVLVFDRLICRAWHCSYVKLDLESPDPSFELPLASFPFPALFDEIETYANALFDEIKSLYKSLIGIGVE
jgi:hypothetical protein